MLRRIYDFLARLLTRNRTLDNWAGLAQEARPPDPYVWRLPNPHDARRRRWSRRALTTGHRLPVLQGKDCRHVPPPPRAPLWTTPDDPVRPCVSGQSAR
jgi:hypothetical protein